MMTRFTVIPLFVAALFSTLSAQSGRNAQPATTPSIPVDAAVFSESQPQPRRNALRPQPPLQSLSPKGNIPAASRAAAIGGEEIIRVDTNLITIPVSVFDRNGIYIPNLKQVDFKIFEDGKEQQIEYFGTADKPFTVVLLLDTSPSTEYKIEEIRRAAIAFVDQLKQADKVMVIEFDGNVHVLSEVTGDRQKIYKAIGKADFGGGTSLYDAVDFSLGKRLNKIAGRKAIVLFTDGVDTTSSKAGYDSTLNLAEESDTLIFPIYYNTFLETNRSLNSDTDEPNAPGTTAEEYAVGKKYLDELSAYTGGRVFRPEATPGGLTAAFEGIAEELRRQYNIGYVPAEAGTAGQRKQIKVRVNRPNLVLRARDSYIVGAQVKP
ncbi:MAG: VWA domain-containing protein [Pyrinomonadaceae bacterium]